MRQKPPERGGAIFLERFRRAWRSLGFRTHIALRSMARNRIRTATGIVSTALAASIIFTSLVLYDSMFYVVDFQFEQVARHADETLGRWLDRAPEARFVATTREVLGLSGETALSLAPMVPGESVDLFVTRARQAMPGFPSDDVSSRSAVVVTRTPSS